MLRGALLLVTSALSFFGLQHMPVAEFTAIGMLTPLLVTLLAALLLREPCRRCAGLLVAGGFVGALIVVRPGSGLFGWAVLLPLAMAFTYASFQVLTSKPAALEHPLTTHFYTGLVGTLIAALLLASRSMWAARTARRRRWTGRCCWLVGLAGHLGPPVLILALGMAPTAMLMPFIYTQIAFASCSAGWSSAMCPTAGRWVGMAVIAACGAAAAWLNMREQPPCGSPAPLGATWPRWRTEAWPTIAPWRNTSKSIPTTRSRGC